MRSYIKPVFHFNHISLFCGSGRTNDIDPKEYPMFPYDIVEVENSLTWYTTGFYVRSHKNYQGLAQDPKSQNVTILQRCQLTIQAKANIGNFAKCANICPESY